MQTFDQALLNLYEEGLITLADAAQVASNPHDFKLLVQSAGPRRQPDDVLRRAAARDETGGAATCRPARVSAAAASQPGTLRPSRCRSTLRLMRCSALSTVLQSQPSSSAMRS